MGDERETAPHDSGGAMADQGDALTHDPTAPEDAGRPRANPPDVGEPAERRGDRTPPGAEGSTFREGDAG